MSEKDKDSRIKTFESINADAINSGFTTKLIFKEDMEKMKATANTRPTIITDEKGEEIGIIKSKKAAGDQLAFDFSKEEIITAELSAVYVPEDENLTPRWVWSDPVIFDAESKRLFMELSPEQRIRFTTDLMAKFYAERPEYDHFSRVLIYEKPIELLNFFKSLTLEDFEACNIYGAETKFALLQSNIENAEKAIAANPIDTDKFPTIWPILSLREMFLESEIAALFYRRANIDKGLQLYKGRAKRQEIKTKAEEQGAIMNLRGGNIDFFSSIDLWDAYSPAKIFKIGSLDPAFIDTETGAITKTNLKMGDEIEQLNAPDISFKAFSLLTAVIKNSVENVRESFVKDGQITFYVKGVLEAFTDDPRKITDNQLNLDRKAAGVLYLENLFAPMQGYIGQLPNGSRWSIFNYIGYDAAADTMTIQAPYIYQLWKREQAEYFETKKFREKLIEQGKKPTKRNYTPLKVNSYFKNKAYNENEITLEIAVYITNRILQAGGAKGQTKKTELLFSELIKKCPRLNDAWLNIETRTNTKNKTALYNAELRKIKRAIDIIQDPEKCDFLTEYEFIDIQPAKINKHTGCIELIPPTKKKLETKLIIVWSRKNDTDLG